jgi:cytochrome c biogenesis protein CcmG, thiol:disulfide interchange protein DsbE
VRRRGVSFFLLLAIGVSCSGSDEPTAGTVRVSGPMPALDGPHLAGPALHASDFGGKVVVVNFWNQVCPPCQREQPELEKAWARLRSQGVRFVGVNYVGQNWPDDPAAARAYLRDFGVTYPTILDPDTAIANAFGVEGIPTTVVVGRSGQLRFKRLGEVREGELDRLVERLTPNR